MVVFSEALEVVVDTAERIGKLVQPLPPGCLVVQHFGLDDLCTAGQHSRCPRQRKHVQRPAYHGQLIHYAVQVPRVPARRHKVHYALFDLIETASRFVHDRALRVAGNLLGLGRGTLSMTLKVLIDLNERRCHRFNAGRVDLATFDQVAQQRHLIGDNRT